MKKIAIVLISAAVIAIVCIGGYLVANKQVKPVACTMEAKICPDGSSVGRTGPKYEFTPCPDQTAGWETYKKTNTNATDPVLEYSFEFKYPRTFSGTTWQAVNWPPKVSVFVGDADPVAGCTDDVSSFNQISSHKNVTVNNKNFVLYTSSDPGAGQLYSTYCYIYSAGYNKYVINFLIHSTNGCGNGNCGPYCGTPNEQACKNFDMQKEVIQPITEIISTLKFNNQ